MNAQSSEGGLWFAGVLVAFMEELIFRALRCHSASLSGDCCGPVGQGRFVEKGSLCAEKLSGPDLGSVCLLLLWSLGEERGCG